jgi:hypothetical protein
MIIDFPDSIETVIKAVKSSIPELNTVDVDGGTLNAAGLAGMKGIEHLAMLEPFDLLQFEMVDPKAGLPRSNPNRTTYIEYHYNHFVGTKNLRYSSELPAAVLPIIKKLVDLFNGQVITGEMGLKYGPFSFDGASEFMSLPGLIVYKVAFSFGGTV